MGLTKKCIQCSREYSKRKPSETRNSRFCSIKCVHKSNTRSTEQIKEKIKIDYEKKVIRKEGCWDWSGYKSKYGYGRINYGRSKAIFLHRASWEIHKGKIPEGLKVLHKCDNPICSNPEHLWLGTQRDNMRDMILKNRKAPCVFSNLKGELNKQHKLKNEQVLEIKRLLQLNINKKEIADRFNVTKSNISHISKKRNWTHIKLKEKRIIIDISQEWHLKIKKQSIDQNTSMKQWLLDAVVDKFKKQKELGWN